MAEATGLRQSLPYPIYACPFGFVIPITEADGDLVTSAAGLDSEISKNGDALADCTNEATEIGGGLYYLLLTATEMTADVITGVTKTSTADAKTTSWSLYPRKLVTVRSGTAAGGDTGYITLDANASAVDDYYNGLVCIATIDSTVEARVITDYTGSSKQASVTPAWNTAPDNDDTFVLKLPEGVVMPTVDVTLWKGAAAPAMTGDAYARLGAPAGASVSADIAAIEAQTDDIGVAGAGLTAITGVTLAADVWAYTSRTLTATAAATTAAVTGAQLNIGITASYAATLSALTIPATWTKIWFTTKKQLDDTDAAAALQIVVSNPAVGGTDGVLYVEGAAATVAQRTLGSLTINQAGGTVAIAIDETLTASLLPRGGEYYDVKCLESGGACTILTEGRAAVSRTVTRAVA